MDSDILRQKNSFGRDFLTYLCYKSDAQAGQIKPASADQELALWIDSKIILEDDRATPPNILSYSGDDFTNQDLKQAIRSGKRVREARFRLERGGNAWTFTLRADRFEIAGLKIDMPAATDPEERFFGRILSIEALNTLIDELYGSFLSEVQEKTWKTKGYREFQKWLAGREA
jgi:recombination associated protein RdgC